MRSSVLWSNLFASEQILDERLANILTSEKEKSRTKNISKYLSAISSITEKDVIQ